MLTEFWPSLPGFAALRISEPTARGGQHCFIKFSQGYLAQQGLEAGRQQGFDSEMAKTNMDPSQATLTAPGYTGTAPGYTAPSYSDKGGSWGKGASKDMSGSWGKGGKEEKDTVVVMNWNEKGCSAEMLTEFWPSLSGFAALRISEPSARGGQHCFIKFSHGQAAHEGLEAG